MARNQHFVQVFSKIGSINENNKETALSLINKLSPRIKLSNYDKVDKNKLIKYLEKIRAIVICDNDYFNYVYEDNPEYQFKRFTLITWSFLDKEYWISKFKRTKIFLKFLH